MIWSSVCLKVTLIGTAMLASVNTPRPNMAYLRYRNSEGQCGYVRTDGIIEIIASYIDCQESFCEGRAWIRNERGYAYIDRSGDVAFERWFDGARAYGEGLAPVRIGDLWGYIDHNGQLAIGAQFRDAYPFENGLAVVAEDAGSSVELLQDVGIPVFYHLINRNGQIIATASKARELPYRGVGVEPLIEADGEGWIRISVCDEKAIRIEAEQFDYFQDGFASIYVDGKWWIIGHNGNRIGSRGFDRIESTAWGYSVVQDRDELLVIDRCGTAIPIRD